MSREYHGLPKLLLPTVITVPSPYTGNDDSGEPTMKLQEDSMMVYEHGWYLSWKAARLKNRTYMVSEPGRAIVEPTGWDDVGDGIQRVVGNAVLFESLGEIEPENTDEVVTGRFADNTQAT